MNFFQCIQQRKQGCYTEDLKIGDYQTKFECPLLRRKDIFNIIFLFRLLKIDFFPIQTSFPQNMTYV